MIKQLGIEIGDTVRIADTSQYYMCQNSSNPRCEGVCIHTTGSWGYRVLWASGETNNYQPQDLILIEKGKTMKEFTKSDLIKLAQTETVFVKQREGMYMLVLKDRAVGNTGFTLLSDVCHNLLASMFKHLDIVAVYKASGDGVMTDYMEGNELILIWERTEQTPAQKEMEVLQVKMNESQAKMNELQAQMKVVQAKL
jgi:hypothetical protein